MTIFITRLVYFEGPRKNIVKQKVDYLKKYKYSHAIIESLLYANGHSLKEINEHL